MSREPIQLYPEPEEPEHDGQTPLPPAPPHPQLSGALALVSLGCFAVAIVMGWGLIGLLIFVGVLSLMGALLFALPRRRSRS